MSGTDLPDVTAHHEAALAVVLYRTVGFVGGEVTIIPNAEKGVLGHALDAFRDSFNPDHERGHVLSCYAGGLADRRLGFDTRDQCETDEALAAEALRRYGWEQHEESLREESRVLVDEHWNEISAVAEELLRTKTLDDIEVELIADIAANRDGVTLADLERYRAGRDASNRSL